MTYATLEGARRARSAFRDGAVSAVADLLGLSLSAMAADGQILQLPTLTPPVETGLRRREDGWVHTLRVPPSAYDRMTGWARERDPTIDLGISTLLVAQTALGAGVRAESGDEHGTLGAVVEGGPLAAHGLTAGHVVIDHEPGTPCLQGVQIVGYTTEFVALDPLDHALVRLDDSQLPGHPEVPEEVTGGEMVEKTGARTDTTVGQVTSVEHEASVIYPGGHVQAFEDLILIEADSAPISEGGDSGSVVRLTNGRPVGMLIGGDGARRAVAHRLSAVLAAYPGVALRC